MVSVRITGVIITRESIMMFPTIEIFSDSMPSRMRFASASGEGVHSSGSGDETVDRGGGWTYDFEKRF